MDSKGHTYLSAEKFWLPLDNAAKIYPAIITDELTSVFRISAVLKVLIRISCLLRAVNILENRFPYYKVRLKKGVFWYYLEHVNLPFSVEVDNLTACRSFEKGKLMFRILAKKNRLSVEFSHILTDGAGAFEFFKSLLTIYFKECGMTIPENFKYYRPSDAVEKEEYEDSYIRYFKNDVPSIIKKSKAFHLPYSLSNYSPFDVISAVLPLHEIKEKAAGKGVNITVYLISVYLLILQEIRKKSKVFYRNSKSKILRIQVPVNLRNIYPSKTMRNFSLFIMPKVDLRLGYYSFDEIIKSVYHQVELETDEKLINKNIARNVGSEKKILVRGVPLFLKSMILSLKYYSLGTSQYSGVLTNLGKVTFPPEMSNLIDYFVLIPPPPNKMLKVNCGIIGFSDKLIMSFGNITGSKELEQKFLKFLVAEGINIKIIKSTN